MLIDHPAITAVGERLSAPGRVSHMSRSSHYTAAVAAVGERQVPRVIDATAGTGSPPAVEDRLELHGEDQRVEPGLPFRREGLDAWAPPRRDVEPPAPPRSDPAPELPRPQFLGDRGQMVDIFC